MNKTTAAKTLLTVAPLLEQFCEALKKANHANAIRSFNGTIDTLALCDKIIEQTLRADSLHNLKIKIQRLIDSLPRRESQVLHSHFLDQQTTTKTAEDLNVTQRTVFRRLKTAVDDFAQKLDTIAINSFTFDELLRRNRWISAEYKRQQQLANHRSGVFGTDNGCAL